MMIVSSYGVQKVPGPGQIMGLPRGLDSCSSCYSGDTGQDGKQNRSQLSIIISLSCCQSLHSTDPGPAPSLSLTADSGAVLCLYT